MENRYNVEKRVVFPLMEKAHGFFYDDSTTNIENIELNNFENHVIYKCFNEETGQNDLVFYKKGDNKPLQLEEGIEKVKNSILAVEDPYFKSTDNMSFSDELRVHRGVDWISTGRAFYNTKIKNTSLEGGSTITQQVLKKTLDNDNVLDRSSRYDLKMEEILLAGEAEEKFGKDTILETYINSVYMGNQISGIGAAIKNYFNIEDPKEATYEQALSLAAAISNPNGVFSKERGVLYKISRGKEIDELTPSERSTLQTWMAKYNQGAKTLHDTLGLIDEDKYSKIKINKDSIEDFILDLQLREIDITRKKEKTQDLSDVVTRHIVENDFVIDGEVVEGSYLLNKYPGVVEVTTAIDPEKNKMLKDELLSHMESNIFKSGLSPNDVDMQTLLENIHPSGAITNDKGHIIAYYPSKEPTEVDFLSYTPRSSNSIVNTGSTLKPIIMYFVKSLEGKEIDEKFLPNEPIYRHKPTNWDGRNDPELEFSIEETLQESINRPTAQAWMKYPRVRNAIQNMFEDYGLDEFKDQRVDKYSISLGVDVEYPLFIQALYGALLTDGKINYPQLIVDIKANGKEVEYADEQMRNLLEEKKYFPDKEAREAILESLLDNSGVPLTAIKTGTHTNKEGNITASVSYLNQKKPDTYTGVNQFFVSYNKEKNLNDSQIGYSRHGSKIALENVVEGTNEIKLDRLREHKFDEWEKKSEVSENSLVRSSINTLYDDIKDGKYSDLTRFYELERAFEQANINSENLLSEEGYLKMNKVREMLNQYEKDLPPRNFIIDNKEKTNDK